MAKTESTAVTRLIELAHSRPIDPEIGTRIDVDWFGAPMGKPKKRLERERVASGQQDEVTKVVRVPGRKITASPAMVVGAFFAGVLSVAVTMLVMGSDAKEAPASAPASASTVATRSTLPSTSRSTTTTRSTSTSTPTITTVVAAVPEPIAVAEPVAEPVIEAPRESAVDRPTRPARPHALTRPRVARPGVVREGGGPLAELRVNSKPPCQLYIDGRDMGWTPQRGISVPPGRHTVEFRNREMGVARKVIVDAKVGEIHRVIRDFTEP